MQNLRNYEPTLEAIYHQLNQQSNSTQFYGFFSWFIPILQGAAVTVEAQNIFNAVQDREGEADALRMQAKTQRNGNRGECLFFMELSATKKLLGVNFQKI